MNRGDHEIGPFKILGPALAAAIAFGGCAQIAVVPQAIAEVDRILLNFDARFLVCPKSNRQGACRPAHWDK
jgi:hypothetical protein